LLAAVRASFLQGMDTALVVSAGIAAVGLVLALAFLPGRAASKAGGAESMEESPDHRHVSKRSKEGSVLSTMPH
jgi:hypothetical protein